MDSWTQLKDYPKYAAHPDGHIKNLETGCVVAGYKRKDGYTNIVLTICPNNYKTALLHMLIAETFLEPRPLGHEVDHKDRNRANNRADNLQWLVPKANHDKVVCSTTHQKRIQSGMLHGNSVLSDKAVAEIRFAGSMGINQRELGKKYKVSQCTINNIILNKTRVQK